MQHFLLIWLVKLFYPNYWRLSTALLFAQAKHETGNFTSPVFKQNNNYFGMREPSVRETLATGSNLKHATYSSLLHSIKDYFLRQSYFNIKYTNKQQYIDDTLKSNYAEDKQYKSKWLSHYNNLSFVYRYFSYIVMPSLLSVLYYISEKTNNFSNFKNLF